MKNEKDEIIVRNILQDTWRAIDVSQSSLKKINEEERLKVKRLWRTGLTLIGVTVVISLLTLFWYFY
jgi:hypothetical protein